MGDYNQISSWSDTVIKFLGYSWLYHVIPSYTPPSWYTQVHPPIRHRTPAAWPREKRSLGPRPYPAIPKTYTLQSHHPRYKSMAKRRKCMKVRDYGAWILGMCWLCILSDHWCCFGTPNRPSPRFAGATAIASHKLTCESARKSRNSMAYLKLELAPVECAAGYRGKRNPVR